MLNTLQWRQNERDCVSNHRRLEFLLSRLSRCRSKKTSKLRVTGLCEGNSPVTGEFPAQRASNAENVFISFMVYAEQECELACPQKGKFTNTIHVRDANNLVAEQEIWGCWIICNERECEQASLRHMWGVLLLNTFTLHCTIKNGSARDYYLGHMWWIG